jgi:tetratricopeptide (TPR) repeat protein
MEVAQVASTAGAELRTRRQRVEAWTRQAGDPANNLVIDGRLDHEFEGSFAGVFGFRWIVLRVAVSVLQTSWTRHRAGTRLAQPLPERFPMLARFAMTALCVGLLSIAPLHAQSSVTTLNDAGWKALQSDKPDRAAALFAEGLTLRPDEPVLLLGAGAAAEAQKKHREAIARLQRALELDPRLTPASRLLGHIAYQQGDVDLAVKTYEKALKYAPGDAQLRSELDAWRQDAAVHQRFEERRYDRFRVMFEGRAEESLAAQATAVLDSAFWRIGEKLGEYPPDTVVAILYTEKQFRDITRAPEWSGGQYDGRIRIPVDGAAQKPDLFARVLTHELSHAIVAGIAPRGVPAWVQEGLAQYFEGIDPQAARRRMMASGRRIPLQSLERSFGHLNAADAQIAYDESLLAVGVIFDRPAFGWSRLLHELSKGPSFERVLDSFAFTYADLEAAFAH